MSIYALKPKFQNLLRPLVRQLVAKGVTANQVTLIACLLSDNPSCAVAAHMIAYMIRTYDATNEVTHTHCPELHISNPAPYQ